LITTTDGTRYVPWTAADFGDAATRGQQLFRSRALFYPPGGWMRLNRLRRLLRPLTLTELRVRLAIVEVGGFPRSRKRLE
jgi:hypothetical protein